jgi:hypothetical protein
MTYRDIFHKISYIQYPLILVAAFYGIKPYWAGFHTLWESYNSFLLFAGLSLSIATLQDTTKTQNEFSRRIWESPKKGKRMIVAISAFMGATTLIGLYGFYFSPNPILKEISFGTMIFGIGLIGLLKSAIEMFENHRKDRVS